MIMLNEEYSLCCPECHNTSFKEDTIHCETYCSKCGLVLAAPVTYGFVFPGFMIIKK